VCLYECAEYLCKEIVSICICHPYDIIAITETFIDPSVDNSEFAPRCYSVFHRDRNCHGGGVMMLVCDHIPVTHCCQEFLLYDYNNFNQ